MSFRCQQCNQQRPNNQNPDEFSPRRVVTKTRSFEGLPGSQIAEEQNLCARCAAGVVPTHTIIKPEPRVRVT